MFDSALPALRFLTCGSVDDGKSTLIGRLLYETQQIFDDELGALKSASAQYGTVGDNLDLALLVDGLQAEREQGITIDVAYRYFASFRRRFVVADTPGHEQYTRNMATGASTADLAVILVDARKGILTQTKRHLRIVAMMGIGQIVLVVNKMDLVGYAEAAFQHVAEEGRQRAASLRIARACAIPISALNGDNVVRRTGAMEWYSGPTLLDYLESAEPNRERATESFRLPVQLVCRPNSEFRGVCGRIAAGTVTVGDRIRILPSRVESRIARIVGWEGERTVASYGDSVTLTFSDEVDASRGDAVVSTDATSSVADQFEAVMLWMGNHPLLPGRPYLLKLHHTEVPVSITAIKFREDVDTGARLSAATLSCNEIGRVTLSTSQPIVFEPFRINRTLGGFVVLDKLTYDTVGAGMIDCALARSATIPWQQLDVSKRARADQKQQKPCCIWFTGLPGAGKSTIANALERRLYAAGVHTYLLDGDNVRHGLNRDLGFTEADRVENVRRVAEVSKLMVDAGLVVLVSLISPFRAERLLARGLFEPDEFIEVYVDAPLAVCEERDPKGLYARARGGEIHNFTGIDSEYEAPPKPESHVYTNEASVDECVEQVLRILPRWSSRDTARA